MEVKADATRLNSTNRKSRKNVKRKPRNAKQQINSAEVDSDPRNDDDEVTDAAFHQRLLDKLQSLDSDTTKK